jgi:hypothetical protein
MERENAAPLAAPRKGDGGRSVKAKKAASSATPKAKVHRASKASPKTPAKQCRLTQRAKDLWDLAGEDALDDLTEGDLFGELEGQPRLRRPRMAKAPTKAKAKLGGKAADKSDNAPKTPKTPTPKPKCTKRCEESPSEAGSGFSKSSLGTDWSKQMLMSKIEELQTQAAKVAVVQVWSSADKFVCRCVANPSWSTSGPQDHSASVTGGPR